MYDGCFGAALATGANRGPIGQIGPRARGEGGSAGQYGSGTERGGAGLGRSAKQGRLASSARARSEGGSTGQDGSGAERSGVV